MKQKNLLFRIFLVIFLVAVAGIIGLLVRDHIQKDKDRKLRDKAAVSVQEEPEVSAEPEETPVQIPVDFSVLQAENPDIYAWIRIADTPVELHNNLAEIEASDIHSRLGLEKGKYILLSAHREENIDTEKNFLSLFNAINKMAEKYDMPILYSCHPRSKKRIESTGFKLDPRVIQHEPLGFHDYNCLQMNAFAVVSDSGTLPEESSFFTSVGHPFPAVCIRTSTERPEALDKACFILSGIDEKGLLQSVDTAVEMNRAGDYGIPVPDYIEENVSSKVVKIIQSYTGVVNKMVWRKEV